MTYRKAPGQHSEVSVAVAALALCGGLHRPRVLGVDSIETRALGGILLGKAPMSSSLDVAASRLRGEKVNRYPNRVLLITAMPEQVDREEA